MPSRPDPRQAIGGTQEDIRRHNLATLVGHLHVAGPLRRAELTGLMGVNRSTIAALVAELVALGVVREDRPAGLQPGAGRPSLVVWPRSESIQVFAADVGVNRAAVAQVGFGGRIVATRRLPLRSSTPSAVVEAVAGAVETLRGHPAAGPRILGLGVAVPGVIRREDGNVRFAPNLGWVDVPFQEMLAEALPGLPVRIGNDADLGAIAEHRRGAARGVDDVVFIACEEGVGSGLILGGRPVQGASGYAGEVGHMTIRPGGRPCRCGARGCWETEIGADAIAGAVLGVPEGSTMDALVSALASLPPERAGDLDRVAEAVGVGVGNVVNLLNPRLVVLGGLLAYVFRASPGRIAAALDRTVLRAPGEQVRLAVPELGADAVLLGASELAWLDLLTDPATALAGRIPAVGEGERVAAP